MSDPNVTPQPGMSDLSFDDVFNTLDNVDQAAALEPQTPVVPAPQVPVVPEPFLRTPTGTVYMTREDAERGFAEKDRVIEQSRAATIAATGYDPVTGKPVNLHQNVPQDVSYSTNPEKYYDDLAAANNKGDKREFTRIQQKFLQDTYGPLLTTTAKSAAIHDLERTVKTEKGFQTFLESDQYRGYLDSTPIMKQAIEMAENNPSAAPQLRDLYAIAYEASQGRNIAQVIAQNRVNTPAPTGQTQVTQQVVRPTLVPSTPSMPSSSPSVERSLSTPEGRKAILEQGRAAGLDKLMGNTVFASFGQ